MATIIFVIVLTEPIWTRLLNKCKGGGGGGMMGGAKVGPWDM
eukprot:COSAG01_NODE_890_length_12913_cov_10.881302_3_plen_42_part_00